jgi:purine-nucleoside phosphorylase
MESAENQLPAWLTEQPIKLAVVLGSGLGEAVAELPNLGELPYAQVPGLPISTVPGHAGKFILAQLGQQRVLFALGRVHLYEGKTAREVTAGVRWLAEIGIERLVLTNAAGSLTTEFGIGQLMLLTDHLNLQGTSPLEGAPHFIDLSEVYSRVWREEFLTAADRLQLPLHEGIYAAVRGPQYETPAEIRMLGRLGAHAVGMSTVLEAIQARALGLEVVGISCLTNLAAGLHGSPLDHSEVSNVGRGAGHDLLRLLREVHDAR